MKKIICTLLLSISFLFLYSSVGFATVEVIGEDKIEVGFGENLLNGKKDGNKKPEPYQPKTSKKPVGSLPQTGEVFQTLIVLFVGIGIVLVSMGVAVLRQVLDKSEELMLDELI